MTAPTVIEKHYRCAEAADLLSVHPRTLTRWIGDGTISPVVFLSEKESRIPASVLARFIEQRTVRRAPQAR